MCQALGVARGGYYRWEVCPKSRRAVENERLLFEIRCAYARSRRTYGSPRITAELHSQGFACSRPRVARLMRRNYIRAKTKRHYRITTHSKHNLPIVCGIWLEDGLSYPSRIWYGYQILHISKLTKGGSTGQ